MSRLAAGDARDAGAAAAVIDAYLRAALARDGVPADFGKLWP